MKNIKAIYLIPLKYGGIASVISIILFLVLYYFGPNPLLIPAFLDFRILLFPIMLVFGIREYKEIRNEGVLHFWQGMSIGMQIVIIIALSMGFFIFIFGTVIETGFVGNYIQHAISEIRNTQSKLEETVGSEVINKTLEILPTTTIVDLSIDYFLKSLPYGIFLTIIISLLLRKKTF